MQLIMLSSTDNLTISLGIAKLQAFLRNMVRAVVGTLLEVGRGKLTIRDFRRVIEQKDRCRAGTSVPGNALFLVDVAYPEETFISG